MKKNARNLVIALAMALVAIIAIISIIVVVARTPEDKAAEMTGDFNVSTTWPEVEPTEEVYYEELHVEDPETRVILVDQSGSMNGMVNFAMDSDENSNYVTFSDWLGKSGGNSHIAQNLTLVLDMGVKDVVLVSDLESYPESDLNAFDGKFYSARRVYVFVPTNVNQDYLNQYKEKLSACLDEKDSTLVFKSQGSEEVIFDNYKEPGVELRKGSITVHPQKVEPDINVVDTHEFHEGNYIAPSVVRNIWIAFIVVTALLTEIILALLLRGFSQRPEWVDKVVDTKNVALDGSSSVQGCYNAMLRYLKPFKNQIQSLWLFASNVRKLTFDEAKGVGAGGQTAGWSCLAQMQKDGIEELTIVSDMEFNDNEISGLHFKKIIFVVPSAGHDASMLERLKTLADESEVVTL